MTKSLGISQTCLDLDLKSSYVVRRAYIVVIQIADSQTGRQTETDTDRNMDHLGINVDRFLWVPSIAEISPRIFEDN